MVKRFYFYLLFFLMLLLTLIGFDESLARFSFASGSDSLMTLFSLSPYYALFFHIIFVLVLFFSKKNVSKVNRIFLILLFCAWALCGRTLALFPDGKVKTGFFYQEFYSFYVCNDMDDCETFFYKEFECKRAYLGFYKLKTKTGYKTLFVDYPLSYQFERTLLTVFHQKVN